MKISVVIPAYNAERFLPRCLASVFAQTLKPDEVIVVDDGSTDKTAEVAEALGARVIRKQNCGVSAARNTGIQSAIGEWIGLLDADDMWMPEKLARQVACIGPETVLVYAGVRCFNDGGVLGDGFATDTVTAKKVLRYRNPIAQSTVLLKREAALRVGGYPEDVRTCEDWDLWMRLDRVGKFEAVADPLVHYYVYPQSVSANPDAMIKGLYQIIDRTLLLGLRGFDRWAWRRRILATQLSSAGLIARDNRLKSEASYMIRSLCAWPSPWWEPHRFRMCAVSIKNLLRGK